MLKECYQYRYSLIFGSAAIIGFLLGIAYGLATL